MGEPMQLEDEIVEVNGKIDDWFKKAWAKITKFFQDLGEKIKKAFKDFGIDMKDFGKKIKEAFDKLGVKIKEFLDKAFPVEVRKKIMDMLNHYVQVITKEVDRLVQKYKGMIIAALIKDGKIIIEEGQKLLIAAVNEGAKVIEWIIKKITGNDVLFDDLDDGANGIKDLWEKIKAFVKDLVKKEGAELKKLVAKYAPKMM